MASAQMLCAGRSGPSASSSTSSLQQSRSHNRSFRSHSLSVSVLSLAWQTQLTVLMTNDHDKRSFAKTGSRHKHIRKFEIVHAFVELTMSAALASRQNQAPLPSVEARQALSTPAVQCNEREENGNSLRLRSIVTDFNKHLCSLLISPDETKLALSRGSTWSERRPQVEW